MINDNRIDAGDDIHEKIRVLEELCVTLYMNIDIDVSKNIEIPQIVSYLFKKEKKTIEKYQPNPSRNSRKYTGDTVNGIPHGHGVFSHALYMDEGTFVNGEEHGKFHGIVFDPNNADIINYQEDSYMVRGKKTGLSCNKYSDHTSYYVITYDNGIHREEHIMKKVFKNRTEYYNYTHKDDFYRLIFYEDKGTMKLYKEQGSAEYLTYELVQFM